ncbi:MAG TPA: hypothetical protein PKE64_20770 [Anaerolineae bacterium]|nr:hypothetical protein [Anaerolineae bacterium]HMR66453.1 hypothetical protein [Anaerolineae bacterium]
MTSERPSLNQRQDHIMANTWRLIFEQEVEPERGTPHHSVRNFSILEQLLPEYRLIGHSLAGKRKRSQLD